MSSAIPHSTTTDDLRRLVERDGPFLTAIVPTRSNLADADHRFDVQTHNALRDAPEEWADDVARLESELGSLDHGEGAAVIAIRPQGGPTFHEFIDSEVHRPGMWIGPLPRLAPLIEARQRVIAHVVVDADLAGADLIAFDGGSVTATEQVDGDTEHIHRGHPGGWSQRRFQQRAENTWVENANDVADAVVALAERVNARIILVAGPTRAQSMITALLEDRVDVPVAALESGDDDGSANEIVRLVSDIAARDTKIVLDALSERVDHRALRADDVVRALDEGRVDTLLVHDVAEGDDDRDRIVDRCIRQALLTDAGIRAVPNVASLDDGVAAILRW